MEFLETLDTIRTEEASIGRLFNRAEDGAGVHTLSQQRRRRDPKYGQLLAEAATFVREIYTGQRPFHHLTEAMTTSDFPLLFGDILDRSLLASYQEAPSTWRAYAARKLVRDFRDVKRFRVDGAEGVLPEVAERDQYPESALIESRTTYRVKKYGRRIPFSFEAITNDDLEAFRTIPDRFGKAARRTEDKLATQLHVGGTGPLNTVYTVGNGNIITLNPALSIAALQTAMELLGNMKDADGEPITVETVVLEVPPALRIVAMNILNALQIEVTTAGGTVDNPASGTTGGQRLITQNWVRDHLSVVVNPYIPIVATTNGSTSWFLHANPGASLPAFELGFLTGHESPEIFIKAPNAQRIGGGMDLVDFDTDALQYKIRHVVGAGLIEPRMTLASNGTGI